MASISRFTGAIPPGPLFRDAAAKSGRFYGAVPAASGMRAAFAYVKRLQLFRPPAVYYLMAGVDSGGNPVSWVAGSVDLTAVEYQGGNRPLSGVSLLKGPFGT